MGRLYHSVSLPRRLGSRRRPLAVVLGTEGAGGIEALRGPFEQQAAMSTRGKIYWVEGANHASLVDRKEHEDQTRRAIAGVVEAVRAK